MRLGNICQRCFRYKTSCFVERHLTRLPTELFPTLQFCKRSIIPPLKNTEKVFAATNAKVVQDINQMQVGAETGER